MIIGTPGRLKDIISNHGQLGVWYQLLIDRRIIIVVVFIVIIIIVIIIDVSLKASHVSVLVLDEVDSLLEMGFDDQVN